jgi:broad specificity phosphatase PhoE
MRIYLITHAHTEQLPGVAADAWRLSARGSEQASTLASAPFWDEVERVVVSSEPKTLLTVAEVVRQRNLPVWIDSRFDELRRSGWTENYATQVAAVFAEPSRSIAGWEAVGSVRQRALSGLADLQVRFAGETLALVGHGLCLSILRAEVLGLTNVDFAAWQRLAFASYASIILNPPTLVEDFPISANAER